MGVVVTGGKKLMSTATNKIWAEVREAYSTGYSDVEVMKLLKMTKTTFYTTMEDNEDFREFIEMGRVLSEAWWMEQGRTNLKPRQGERFDTALFTFMTKNRFGWSEKLGIDKDNPGSNLTTDELATKSQNYMHDQAKKLGRDVSMSEILTSASTN